MLCCTPGHKPSPWNDSTNASAVTQEGTGNLNGSIDWNSPLAFLITSKDGGVIFNLDRDDFCKLNPVALDIWTLIARNVPDEEVVRRVAEKYRVEQHYVAADLENLRRMAAEQGLRPEQVKQERELSAASSAPKQQTFPWYGQSLQAPPRPEPGLAMVIRAVVALAWFDLTLRTRSLKDLCRKVCECPLGFMKKHNPDHVGRVCTAVDRACVWYPKKALCLQRSAATTFLLRRYGVPGQMVVGARVMPMTSHAWVEVDSAVVNDHPKVKSIYQPLVSF